MVSSFQRVRDGEAGGLEDVDDVTGALRSNLVRGTIIRCIATLTPPIRSYSASVGVPVTDRFVGRRSFHSLRTLFLHYKWKHGSSRLVCCGISSVPSVDALPSRVVTRVR